MVVSLRSGQPDIGPYGHGCRGQRASRVDAGDRAAGSTKIWRRTQYVLMWSTGPLVDQSEKRSVTSAGTPQVGSGHTVSSNMYPRMAGARLGFRVLVRTPLWPGALSMKNL